MSATTRSGIAPIFLSGKTSGFLITSWACAQMRRVIIAELCYREQWFEIKIREIDRSFQSKFRKKYIQHFIDAPLIYLRLHYIFVSRIGMRNN